MSHFQSDFSYVCNVVFPEYTGLRVMMMPFWPASPGTSLPEGMRQYVPMLKHMMGALDPYAVGYLTIDEALVFEGETHRRPGLHVDGVGEAASAPGLYGGDGSYSGTRGMFVAASHSGCRAYRQVFAGAPGPDGNCQHLSEQCQLSKSEVMVGKCIYWCDRLCVHESLPMPKDTFRQFVRVSMPSNAPWHEGYTENPLGIKPTGPIKGRRPGMEYRP